jgi:regulator of sigma E protease
MTTLLSTVFVLGVLIFIHELGHFLVAKWSGIRVDRFSLGFPPSIVKRKVGETEYCIGAVPLGGYVKMAGENPDEEATGAPYEFMSKPVRIRTAVVAAGPFMNFVLAWLIMWGIFFFQGVAETDPDHAVIGVVSPDGPAHAAGLMEGDIITAINGTPVSSFADMAVLISNEVEKPIAINWQRNDQEMSATITTIADETYNAQGEKIAVGRIGVGEMGEYRPLGFVSAAVEGFSETIFFVKMIGKFVWDLVSLKISAKMIGGPVFIAQMAGQRAQLGFSALLVFMAFLSVNLAILNILPIPALDGGHLIFLLIEKLKGSPLTVTQRMIAQQIGLVFLIIVIVMVTYNDIVRFVAG